MHKKQPEKLKKFFENKVQHKSFWQTFRSAAQKLRFPDKISKLMYVWVIPMLLPGMMLADINFKYSVDSFKPFLCYVYRMHLIKVTRSRRDFLGAIKYFPLKNPLQSLLHIQAQPMLCGRSCSDVDGYYGKVPPRWSRIVDYNKVRLVTRLRRV